VKATVTPLPGAKVVAARALPRFNALGVQV
jgi:hypothetical protein